MRVRSLICILAVCLLLALAGTRIVRAQTQGLHERNARWESRTVIGMPGDDDDEGDDEGCDCPPYPAPVAATGQTECFDVDGPVDCVGTGQDGEYQIGITVTPRFVDNGDGTVTDNLTGLIWLQDSNCWALRNWTAALSEANSLAEGSCELTDGSISASMFRHFLLAIRSPMCGRATSGPPPASQTARSTRGP